MITYIHNGPSPFMTLPLQRGITKAYNALGRGYVLFLLGILFPFISEAQFVLTDGKKSLEISGVVYTYYNRRFYEPGEDKKDKNLFRLRDARVKFVGDLKKKIKFNIDINFAELPQLSSSGESTTYNPFLNDANVTWETPGEIDITVGYQGIEYSRSSMASIFTSPFMERTLFAKGDYFHRRDLGVSINRKFWDKRIRLNAGVFNGLGIPLPDNDRSGNLLYSARADFSYPNKIDFDEADLEHIAKPNFAFGINGMYSNKQQAADPEYPIYVNGKRYVYGADFQIMYKGFALQAEINQIRGNPRDTADLWLNGQNTNFFRSGSWAVGGSYYFTKLKSLVGVRYEDVNQNDIIQGDDRRQLSIAYTYTLNDFKTCLRIQYWKRFNQALTGQPWNEDQLRIGIQVLIK